MQAWSYLETNSWPLKTKKNYFLIWLKKCSEVIWIWLVMDLGLRIMIQDSVSLSPAASTMCFLVGFILGQHSINISYYFRFFHNPSLWWGFILTGSIWIIHCGYCYLDPIHFLWIQVWGYQTRKTDSELEGSGALERCQASKKKKKMFAV